MPVQISVNTDLSLSDLIAKKACGYMVEETPHVGNLSVSTLATLTLGMAAKLVDANIGSKDNLFYPHCMISGGQSLVIADAEKISTHNRLSKCGTPISEVHLRPLAGRQMNAYTHSSWMSQRREVLIRIISATLRNCVNYRMWGKFVTSDGHICQRAIDSSLINMVHKVTVAPDDAGFMVPNPMNILFDLVCGAMESGRHTVYMLSGQSMYKYILHKYRELGPMVELISRMYDLVRLHEFAELPENLKVIMVPVPVLRHYVAPLRMKEQLDRKLLFFQKMMRKKAHCWKQVVSGKLSQRVMIDLHNKRKAVFHTLAQPMEMICADSENGIFYTQHDLAYNNDVIYVPDYIMELPFKILLDNVARMQHLLH